MNLDGAKILITGGSLGIGKAIAALLVNKGSKVGITGREKHRLDLAAKTTGAFPFVADVTKSEDIDLTFRGFLEKFGGLDVLINNAGFAFDNKPITDVEIDEFHQVFSTNVFGAAMMTKRAARLFKEQNYGTIVNVGSTAALAAYEGGSVYVSSKFALRGLTKCWQMELGRFNIRVMLVNPGDVSSAFRKADRREEVNDGSKLEGSDVARLVKCLLEMDGSALVSEVVLEPLNAYFALSLDI